MPCFRAAFAKRRPTGRRPKCARQMKTLGVTSSNAMATHFPKLKKRTLINSMNHLRRLASGIGLNMSPSLPLLAILLAFPTLLGAAEREAGGDLGMEFQSPPNSARMWTWWFWLGDKVDKESITADLEAFKAQGMAGVTVYSLSGPGVPGKGPSYMSAEWRALWKHTLKEADRLGLGVSTMLCSGWNAGGPWIKPEQACKRHVHSELILDGPQHFKGKLPLPGADQRFYRDVAVQAVPITPAIGAPLRREGGSSALVALKTLSNAVNGGAPTKEINEAVLQPLPTEEPGTAIDPAAVVDLSARCDADGTLDWDVPAGRWKILRTGFTLTGAMTSWSSPTGAGFESDPLDAAVMEFQVANVVAPLVEDAGPLVGKVFRSVQIDSWEIKHPNWTAGLIGSFKKFRGYDPRPFLPTLAGTIVGTAATTERFLYDYRKTVGDCVAEHYFGRLSQLAEAKGLIQQSEAGGVCSPTIMAMDCLKNLGRCAIPMGEFWQNGAWVEANQNKNGKQTASAAHLYGKRIAAAEAFTSFLHWEDSPASLKPTADRAFCEGFNHFFIFSSATRSGDGFPGTEFAAGTHFNSKITWWNQAHGFSDYVARCSHLLQQGLFVADVLFYNGDGCPNFVPPRHVDPSLGPGFDYDVCNSEIILTRLAMKDGRIVLPEGMNYRLLVLPESATMPVEVLAKLKDLVAAGMTLVGPKPKRAPGLTDYPHCDEQVKSMADELWGDCDDTKVKEHAFGKGRVVWGKTVRELLAADGVTPDFSHSGGLPDTFLDWIHRRVGETDIYFVANRRNRAETAACTFRVRSRQPELWDAVTGAQRDAVAFSQSDGGTSVLLEFPPNGSQFVVFRRAIAADAVGKAESNYAVLVPVMDLSGPWKVSLDPKWGGPEQPVVFGTLSDWTNHSDPRIKYYSGKATYRMTFDCPAPRALPPLFLDLGNLNSLAEVRLNGKPLGILWTQPYRIALGDAVKAGTNLLEIDIVNLWPNRLIGDGRVAPNKRLTRTNIDKYYKGEHKLLPSGLLGPVRILKESENLNAADQLSLDQITEAATEADTIRSGAVNK